VNIVLIGTGNLASHLGRAFKEAGHIITGIYNHKESQAGKDLAMLLDSKFSADLNNIQTADFYFLAIKDDTIEELAKKISIDSGIVLHTSGTVSIQALSKFKNFGVFYPVQTFSKSIDLNYKSIPICLEANNPFTENSLLAFAKSISEEVHHLSSEKRLKLHLAAVFVNNFTNYLFSVASDILKKEALTMDIIKPLMQETVRKIFENPLSINSLQTGPAKRNDEKTIQKHLKILKDFPGEYEELYKVFTYQIQQIKD
jgi:predicted short-subunit dehydrogenase-like oxidoreductase (DUF2520 family)